MRFRRICYYVTTKSYVRRFSNKFFRDVTGRGPRKITVRRAGNSIVIILSSFLTREEQILSLQAENLPLLLQARRSLLELWLEHWSEVLSTKGLEIRSYNNEIDFQTDYCKIVLDLKKK